MTRSAERRRSLLVPVVIAVLWLLPAIVLAAQSEQLPTSAPAKADLPGIADNLQEELVAAGVRLPLAAILGAALALRPRRRGTPERQPAVVQTQIVLAVVGALIMLVVGASLARAFGIVGAANLIRYRSKIEDPKDAVVMLCTLAVGLSTGVGLYGLALVGTLFIGFALWVIEGFEPQTRAFELAIKLGDKTAELRPEIERVLRRFRTKYELRGSAPEEVVYVVTTPRELHTDSVSTALTELVPDASGAVEWSERKSKGNGAG
jgi:uncharacterized membrane protein YhiD involved in acid resistance